MDLKELRKRVAEVAQDFNGENMADFGIHMYVSGYVDGSNETVKKIDRALSDIEDAQEPVV